MLLQQAQENGFVLLVIEFFYGLGYLMHRYVSRFQLNDSKVKPYSHFEILRSQRSKGPYRFVHKAIPFLLYHYD